MRFGFGGHSVSNTTARKLSYSPAANTADWRLDKPRMLLLGCWLDVT